jgi:hypothetical protein
VIGNPPVWTKITVRTPSLLIWGVQDTFLTKQTAEWTRRYVPNLRLEYVRGASHWVQQDSPETVNRYMLRERTEFGDNLAAPTALAALYRRLADVKLNRLDLATLEAVRSVLRQGNSASLGVGYSKGGSLASNPLTRVHAGWWDTPHGPLVYVVMLEQPNPGTSRPSAASERLRELCTAIRETATLAAANANGLIQDP